MKLQHKATIDKNSEGSMLDYLADKTALSKIKIKKAIGAGGCWISRPHLKRGKLLRLRKIKYELKAGDRLEFYFDDNALVYGGPAPVPLHQKRDWALWYKPVNVLSGASRYGEVCAIDYLIKEMTGNETVHVINRLDREASGIVAVAYSKRGAARLSELWQGTSVEKVYQLKVRGHVAQASGDITFPVLGKEARTEYTVDTHYIDELNRDCSQITARIRTGRFHQIRQHFSKLGHPVLGDPKYGEDNHHPDGLQLVSSEVHFVCPFSKKNIDMVLPAAYRLW